MKHTFTHVWSFYVAIFFFFSFYPITTLAMDNPDISNLNVAPYASKYGSSYWPTSNIREWLNSDMEPGQVLFTNDAPTTQKLGSDGYADYPGFLYEFTNEEKSGIAITERRNYIHGNYGRISIDGGSGNLSRFDGLVPSNNIHISSPDIDKRWKDYSYQIMREKVYLLGINEIFEYVQKRGLSTKKGLTDALREDKNISSPFYQYLTSSYNYSNTNSETLWAYNSNGFGQAMTLNQPAGIVPALHLKPDFSLSNGKQAHSLSIGEEVIFGMYKGERLKWVVINKTPEGYPLLWSKDSVDILRFDAPGDVVFKDSESISYSSADISIVEDLKYTNGEEDITTPYLKVRDDTNMNERQNSGFELTIDAVDQDSGVDYIILPNGNRVYANSVTYYFPTNARYYFTAVDKAGNHYGFEVPVGNINPPAEVIVKPSVTGWTNKDVTVSILTNQMNTDWKINGTKRLNRTGLNSSYFPEYTTYAGKRYRVTGKVRLVEKQDDRFSTGVRIMYNRIIPFGNNYRVARTYPLAVNIPRRNLSTEEYTSFDNILTVDGSYFENINAGIAITHGAIENGKYQVEFKDVEVILLDKEDFYIEKIILPNGDEVFQDSYVDTLSEEGIYTYRVLDNRGMTTEKEVEVKIDKTKPTIEIDGNPTEDTDQDVQLHIQTSDDRSGVKRVLKPNGEWDSRAGFTYNIFENGTYSFTVEDYAGNQTTKVVSVSNIDVTKPTLKLSVDHNYWSNTSTLIEVEAEDNVEVDYIVLPNGEVVQKTHFYYEVRNNGTYTFRAYDTRGNSMIVSVEIQTIDFGIPFGNIVLERTEKGINHIRLEYADQ